MSSCSDAARCGMVERPRDEVHLRGVQTVQRGQARQDRRRIRHAAQGALRLAGGARRVDHRAADGRRRGRRRLAAPREQIIERLRPRPPLGAERDPVLDARGAAHALGHRQERVPHERRRRVGVVEDVGDLLDREAVIHRHPDRAERAQGGADHEVLQGVVRVDDRVLARAESQARQRVGQPVPRTEKLFPGQRPLVLDEGRPVRLPRGVGGDQVHGGESLPPAGPPCAQQGDMAHGRRDPISRLQPLLQVVILAFALFCLGIAEDVFIPIALAMLLTFVLSPIVERLQRWHLPRVVAVVATVAFAFSVLGGLGWLLASRVGTLADALPPYTHNLTGKIRQVRRAGKSNSLEKAQSTVKEVIGELQKDGDAPKQKPPLPVVVEKQPPTGLKHETADVDEEVLLPTLSRVRRDAARGALTPKEAGFIAAATRRILDDLDKVVLPAAATRDEEATAAVPGSPAPRARGCPARDDVDVATLQMLASRIAHDGVRLELTEPGLLAELVERVAAVEPAVVVVALLGHGGLAHARYILKRLRARFSELPVVAACLSPRDDLEEACAGLLDAGATEVATTLGKARDLILQYRRVRAEPAPPRAA